MKKYKLISYFVIFGTILAPLSAAGQSAPTSSTTVTVPALVTQIKDAKAQLEKISLTSQITPRYTTVSKKITTGSGKKKKTVTKTSKVLSNYTLDNRDIVVAVQDPTTGKISLVRGMQNGKSMTFRDPTIDITLIKFNGVNSQFAVSKPAGGKVLALKYLITPVESGTEAQIKNSLSEAIYVPYSDALNYAEVSRYGADYFNNVIQQAAIQLANIRSQSAPGKMITEALTPEYIESVVYIEHLDTSSLLRSDNPQNLINQINVLFAGNEGETFKYSGSSAAALGISQFVKSTYDSLVKRHPEASLVADFRPAMADHVNAIKATYLLLDDYIAAVKTRAGSAFDVTYAYEYGAAGYNGGTTRVANAVMRYGATWEDDHKNELANLQNQVNSQTATVNQLKSKLAKAKKKEKTAIAKQLNDAKASLTDATSQLSDAQSATLKNETINYVLKLRKIITAIKGASA